MIARGAQFEKIYEFLQKPNLDKSEPVQAFSAAVRSINDEYVSKDTYSITLYFNEGKMKYLDFEGNELKF
ncbi:hypothetical protein [Mesobacillus zeae]|uniref:hypothetical protein n=1 Tax=Mesobacillus zeae TaxID=1917180 RepID=UPI00300BE94D